MPETMTEELEIQTTPKQIPLTTQDLGIKTNKLLVDSINLAPDDSGDWIINFEFKILKGVRSNDPSVSVREIHKICSEVKVTRQEIADYKGIPVEDVRTTLTLEETETIITAISLSKVLPVFNLTM